MPDHRHRRLLAAPPPTACPGLEWDVVLSVAASAHDLAAQDRYDVHMTRASDVLSPSTGALHSRRAAASLFISIHADALGAQEHARSVRGATVYTLSQPASSRRGPAVRR